MNRTERLYKIENLLRQHQVVSFMFLQQALEVSRATLKRDLDYLRTRLNAPIEWSRAAGGYRFTAAADPASVAHELPGLWFSSTEIHALQTIKHARTGFPARAGIGKKMLKQDILKDLKNEDFPH